MRPLLDTHVLIWTVESPERLSRKARELLEDPDNDLYLSAVSAWEISMKVGSRKLRLSSPFGAWFDSVERGLDFKLLTITMPHVFRVGDLDPHHKDPFDRMIIAQSLVEGCAIVGADRWFDAYGVERIWD